MDGPGLGLRSWAGGGSDASVTDWERCEGNTGLDGTETVGSPCTGRSVRGAGGGMGSDSKSRCPSGSGCPAQSAIRKPLGFPLQ